MTRIFGYERKSEKDAHIPVGIQKVMSNLHEAVDMTYMKGWQAYGMGFIVVGPNRAEGYSIYKGYRGIKFGTKIQEILSPELHLALANNPVALFGVLQNGPDNGEEEFNNEDKGREFPLQSQHWLGITMGAWSDGGYKDENLPWYDKTRPSLSVIKYLETNPKPINFDWIDPNRTPFLVAVSKEGGQVCIVDKYSGTNEKGFRYVKEDVGGITFHQGLRNSSGEQV